jgi:hypothetical protein
MRAKSLLLSLTFGCLLALNLRSAAQVKPRETPKPQTQQQQPQPSATPGETGKYSGPGSCASSNCHGGVTPKGLVRIAQNEYSIWAAQDKHSRAYNVLSNPTSIRMGKLIGLEQAPNKSDKCLACHALNVHSEQRAQTFQSIDDGVSCESCHGPAVGWLGPHTLKGQSHEQSLRLGMYDTRDLAKRTDRCLTCHLGTPEKEVDHVMIAAGHPDLTFELESFSSSMPRHWRPAQNASPWLSVQELAVGQAITLREGLRRLDRRASGPNWPEFSEYECFACHHSLTTPQASWRQAQGYNGRTPGAPVWNPARYAVLRSIAAAVDPSTANQLVAELDKIEQLSGKPGSNDQLASIAKNAAGIADRVAQRIQAQPYDQQLTLRLLQSLTGDADMIAAQGERSAEQAYMALDSLSLAYARNQKLSNETELRAAIDNLFQLLQNPSAYNAPRFAAQMQKVGALLPRSQASASIDGN